jgi:hypothetical protein
MSRTHAALFCLWLGALAAGCKSDEQEKDRQIETARAQLELARQQAALAQAQLAKAEQQMAASAEKLAKDGAALGTQGAALGVQAAAAGMQAATAAMNKMASSIGGASETPSKLVDFRALKALLPEAVGELKRVKASGEKEAVMGVGASHAKASYEGPAGARLKIKLVDSAPLGFAAAIGLAGMEIDKETEDSYERTTTIDGDRAVEKYDRGSQKGELKVFLHKRFVVEIDGEQLSMDTMKQALSKIDRGKLAALAAAAAP